MNTMTSPKLKRVITFGTFDLFHIGHLRILERAKDLGNWLIVGVSSDHLNVSKKEVYPMCPEEHRMAITRAIRCVDEVFLEESLELKRDYVLQHNADVLVMGDDWKGRFDFVKDICDVVYLPRTPVVSSTEIKNACRRPKSEMHPRQYFANSLQRKNVA
jgi:glycerol-3-phosphate cytidylyltransferase